MQNGEGASVRTEPDSNIQKFFGSFFQKRTRKPFFFEKRSKKLLII